MKKAIIEPVTTAGVETFLAAGNPSLNLLRVEPGIPVDGATSSTWCARGIWKMTTNSSVQPTICAASPRR